MGATGSAPETHRRCEHRRILGPADDPDPPCGRSGVRRPVAAGVSVVFSEWLLMSLRHRNLAPLETRRDLALLGLVHRTVLGRGPANFRQWFFPATEPSHCYGTRHMTRKHTKQLHDYLDGSHTELLRQSALGCTRTYNSLQQEVVDSPSVAAFQRKLQQRAKELAIQGATFDKK